MGHGADLAIVILAREPAAGLLEEIGSEKAAQVYRCFVADAIARVRRVPRAQVYAAWGTVSDRSAAREWEAAGVESLEAAADTLGRHMLRAFDHCLSLGHDRVIAIDARAPNAPLKAVREAAEHLRFLDLVLGPREEGGVYMVGTRGRYPEYFLEAPWEENPAEEQLVGLAVLTGLEYAVLDAWYTIETLADLRLLAQFLQFDVSEDNPCPETSAWLKANLR
jgi:glycosyltransferase A (GT-A) superfamily protein (DUF2064 family)